MDGTGSFSQFFVMAQRRLDALWGTAKSPTGSVTPWEMKITDVAKSADAQIAAESAVKVRAATEQMPYVPNGSRDRWGQLRENVGGRPKKEISEEVQPQISPRKKPIGQGKQAKSEYRG